MKLLGRILLGVIVLLIVLVGVGAIVFNDLTRGVLPTLNGELNVVGLRDRVEIKRDEYGVPYIYASNTYDLFFAQGYVQAQDRWWQMEFFRATGDGRLQELTGQNADLLGTDVFIRTVGWRRAAEQDISTQYQPDEVALMQSFADGVNAYIGGKSGGDLALQYSLLGVTGVNIPIRPWTIADTVVWQKVMSWDLGNRMIDITRSELIAFLGETMYNDFQPPFPFGEKPTIVTEEDLPITDATLTPVSAADLGDATLAGGIIPGFGFAFGQGEGLGSNNWVVSGDLTESGKPLLANDPHLGIQMPSIWYEIGLFCREVSAECPYSVRGFTFAAFPGVVIGHNDRIAWGFTNVGPDVMDLYQLEINPENENQYRWDDQWRDFNIHEETIRYGDSAETLVIRVRETHFGPVVTDYPIDDAGNLGGWVNEGALALRWTGIEPQQTLRGVFEINRATNWEEFRAAMSHFAAPSQNLVYADVDGNIGYQTPGLMPVRPGNVSGLVPIAGSSSAVEWLGYIPYDQLPRVLNPERGYIHSANQALVVPEYYAQLQTALADQFGPDANTTIGLDWDYGYRGQRIVQLLESGAPFSVADFQAIQADNLNLSADEILPYLQTVDLGDLNETRDWLLTWDKQTDMDSPHAALYAAFWSALLAEVYDDQLGDFAGIGGGSDQMWSMRLLLEQPDNVWWDDARTGDAVESRDAILARAFALAHERVVGLLGADRTAWRWGALHTTTFISNPLGLSGISLIEDIVNRGPVATSGDTVAVNATSWDATGDDFSVRAGPSFRMIIDLGDLTQNVNMNTTGQSGHPYSPYYDDLIDLWRNVQYKPMYFTRAQVDAAAVHTLTLIP
ncbi:MAG: penicillin acylase family protein [Anaerolineae bacterium]|jgi:penicillin amidase|nr:penicillin acylase family protein [Anaerolineae bacterium]